MKKIITAIITIALLLSFVTFNVSAEEPKNYLKSDAVWGGVAATSTVKDGIVTTMSQGTAWSSPAIPLFSSLKAALGDADEAEISIIYKAKVTFKAGSDADVASGAMLFRGENALPETGDEEWLEAYTELLGEDDPLFMMSQGNVMFVTDTICEIYPDEWTECRLDFFVTKGQLNCSAVTEWTFCMDRFDSVGEEIFSFEIKDFGVYLTEDLPEEDGDGNSSGEETQATPTPTPTPTPAPAKQTPNLGNNTSTDKATDKVTEKADATPTQAVDNGGAEAKDFPVGIVIAIAAGVVVIAAAVVTVIVIKKKKQG